MFTDLQEQLNTLMQNVQQLSIRMNQQRENKIEEYQDVNVPVNQPNDVSLNIFKSLPEFNGERNGYATWRSMTNIAMQVLANHRESMRYYEALTIIRNKITGTASNILNNYNTPFDFEAIIHRLDFSYADKRPIYISEQELSILQQNELSLDQFYDEVNKKLNCIVNKINMFYKELTIANALIKDANTKAVRTFITGLNDKNGELLYASNPNSLAEAYARFQTIINDQERMKFATQYNQNGDETISNSLFEYNRINQSNNPDTQIEDESKYQRTIMADDNLDIPSDEDDERSSIFLGD